jgi:3-oxoacyl-[acyl-carrier protein] reductase
VNYSAAKAGVIGASKSLAIELGKRNITVNCVAPGLVETDMTSTDDFEHIMKFIPARRVGQPEEVAGLVSYLMSDLAGYVTRQVICIDGGLS